MESMAGTKTVASCHESPRKRVAASSHGDHTAQVRRLKRIGGQITGIEAMISDQRYCMDIVWQVRAARSALKALESEIMRTHLSGCVRQAFGAKNPANAEEKINEIVELLCKEQV